MITFHQLGHCLENKVCWRRDSALAGSCRRTARLTATLALTALLFLALFPTSATRSPASTQRQAIKAS